MRKLTLLTILVLSVLTLPATLTYAATEFASTIAPSGGDYTSLSNWQANNQCDLTAARVMSHSGITGAIADGAYVKGATSGAYGTVVHATSSQICIKGITNTFQINETINVTSTLNGTVSGTGSVVTSTAPDSVCAVAKIDGAWSTPWDNTAVNLTGWTTSGTYPAGNYIKIYTTATARHTGKWNASGYILNVTAGANNAAAFTISPGANNVVIEGLQVLLTNSGGYTGCEAINIASQTAAAAITIDKNIIRGAISNANSTGIGIYGNNSYITGTIYNNYVYNFNASAGSAGIAIAIGGTYGLYNNTVYGNLTGISIGAGTITADNNIANANTVDYSGTIGTHATNLSQDATSPDGAGYQSANGTASFLNAGTGDFHLVTTDNIATGAGTNLSYIFGDDIESITRGYTWDVGAAVSQIAVMLSETPLEAAVATTTTPKAGETISKGTATEPEKSALRPYELLVEVFATAPKTAALGRSSYEEGDIVMVKPAGYLWSAEERKKFLIIQANLTEGDAADLINPKVVITIDKSGKTITTIVNKRKHKVDLSKAGLLGKKADALKGILYSEPVIRREAIMEKQ